jgi:RNA polymerase sigma factor (sigma-70 family)
MPQPGLSAAVSRAGRAALRSADAPPSDGRLLADFVATRDHAAFAELVARHGPMVFAVCRRVTGHRQDAEDAFQAVFVVLARKAAGVSPREAVGNWLYGVAVRTAREARSVSARRRARELPTDRPPDVARAGPEPDDLGAVLHEELAELPDKFRSLLVLCDLEGRPQTEVASRLGLPVGTVYSRLAAARRLLAARLKSRGVGLSAAGLSAALAQVGRAAVPAGLSAKAVAAVVSPGHVPAAVAALSRGVVRSMFLTKLKAVAPIAVAAVALVLLAGALTAAREPQPQPANPAADAPTPNPTPREGEIVVWRQGHAMLLKPDGTKVHEWNGDDVPAPGGARISPDGRTIAILRAYETRTLNRGVNAGGAVLPGAFSRHLFRITLYPAAERLVGTDVSLPGDSVETVLWSADGSKLYAATHADDENYSHDKSLKHYVYDLATRRHSELRLPDGHHLKDVSPDGKRFLTVARWAKPGQGHCTFLVPAGGDPVAITGTNESIYDGRFSPDGKRLLLAGFRWPAAAAAQPADPTVPPPVQPQAAFEWWLMTVSVDDSEKRTELSLKEREYVNQCRWSPDGKRVVTSRQVLPELNQPPPQKEVVVTDADGRNPMTLTTATGKYLEPVFVDWR